MAVIDFQETRMQFLQREIRSFTSNINAATYQWLQHIGEFDRSKYWADWGMKSMAHWLDWQCSMSQSAARDHVRVARALETLPKTCDAFAAGKISFSQVRAITRIATPATERSLISYAKIMTASQLEGLVRKYKKVSPGNQSDEGDQANERHKNRSLSYFYDEDDCLVVVARLGPEDSPDFINAIQSAREELPKAELDDDDRSTEWKRGGADALIEMARRSLGSHSVGSTEVVITVDVDLIPSASAEALPEVKDIKDECVSAVLNGPRVYPESVRRLLCDGPVRTMLTSKQEPLSIGRKSRTLPHPLRIALQMRDEHCQWPGCSTPARICDGHHIQHWSDGGATDLANLLSLCRSHHRAVHEGRYWMEMINQQPVIFKPSGDRLPTTPGNLPGAVPVTSASLGIEPGASQSDADCGRFDLIEIAYDLHADEQQSASAEAPQDCVMA